MARRKDAPGEIDQFIKAVRIGANGEQEIVGFAQWQTVLVGEGGIGMYANENEKKTNEEEEANEEMKVPTVVNGKLCDDLFIPGDASMAKACRGGDYHSKRYGNCINFEQKSCRDIWTNIFQNFSNLWCYEIVKDKVLERCC